MKKTLLVLLMLCASGAFAQKAEISDVEFLSYTPTYKEYWSAYVRRYREAVGFMQQASMILGCDDIASSPGIYLDPAKRALAEDTVLHLKTQGAKYSGPAADRFAVRNALFAYEQLSSAERQSLSVIRNDKEVLQLMADLAVLGDAGALDPMTGQMPVADIVWLKAYFEKEGRLPQLRKAITLAVPKQLANFDKVKTLEQHTVQDAGWLGELNGYIATSEELPSAYLAQAPQAIQERYQAAVRHPIFATLDAIDAAAQFGGMPFGNPNSDTARLLKRLDRAYPMPKEMANQALRMGPPEYTGPKFQAACSSKPMPGK